MGWRERRRRRRIRQHADALAATARMEMDLDVGSWQETVAQMHALLAELADTRDRHRSAEDELISQLRERVDRLQAALHRREDEYDRLQERYCALAETRA